MVHGGCCENRPVVSGLLSAHHALNHLVHPAGRRVILDEGKALFFSAKDEAVRHVALAYARKKWGRGIVLEGNHITWEEKREKEQ